MFRRRIYIIVIILLFFGLGLGCKGLSKEEKAAVRPLVLNYWTVFNDVEQLRAFAAQYKQIRPYVTINIRQVRYEEFDKLFVNALADDVGPDIVSMHTRWLRKYQPRLSAVPKSVNVATVYVKGKFKKETIVTPQTVVMPTLNSVKANLIKTVADDVVIGGKMYGFPLSIDTLAVYYNKDLLDKAGIPEAPSTWAGFLEAVKETTQFDTNGNIIQTGVALGTSENIDNAPDILALLMMQNGLEMTQNGQVRFADGLKKPNANHPAMEALKFYTDFARPTTEAYSWNEDKPNALNEFTRGNTVFYFGFAFDASRIKARAPQRNIDVIPMFQLNQNTPVNVANYWVESVVKKSKHKDEAWDFVRFITSPEGIKVYAEATKLPTPVRSQIEDFKEDVILAPFVSQILQAQNWYRGKNVDVANEALRDLIDAYSQPYSEKDNPVERDSRLIINAATVVQQTM